MKLITIKEFPHMNIIINLVITPGVTIANSSMYCSPYARYNLEEMRPVLLMHQGYMCETENTYKVIEAYSDFVKGM